MNKLATCRICVFDNNGEIIDIVEQSVSRLDDGILCEPVAHTMCRMLSFTNAIRASEFRATPICATFCVDGRLVEEFQVGRVGTRDVSLKGA